MFRGDSGNPVLQSRIEGSPFAMAVSRSDQYVALKFSRFVLIFDTISTEFIRHELPYKNNRSGLNNNLVSFSSDSSSFIASTRYEPEKVITYWSDCAIPSKTNRVESSAPFVCISSRRIYKTSCPITSINPFYMLIYLAPLRLCR